MDKDRNTQSIAEKDILDSQSISSTSATDRNDSGNRVDRVGFPYPFLESSRTDKQGNPSNGSWNIAIVKKSDDPITPGRKQSPQDFGVACTPPDDEITAIKHSTIPLSHQLPDRFA